MTPRLSSATEPAVALIAALAEREFAGVPDVLAPDVRMRALIPPGPVELSGADAAGASFATWFDGWDDVELVSFGSDEVGDRQHVFYRLRVTRANESKVVEQHLFCSVEEGRIAALDLVCSGFRAE